VEKRNAVVGQSGGPTQVINRSLVGVVREARKHEAVDRILAAQNGTLGILDGRFTDVTDLPDDVLERIALLPGAAAGSCRHKPKREECEAIFEVFRRNNVGYFFYIGGNDTAETADIVNNVARDCDYELRVFHIPKTIDNDLVETDHCPGYGSAARYVALAFMGNDLDSQALGGIKIDICMGRDAGWLTAAASLARQNPGDGPHLIYLPERPKSLAELVEAVAAGYAKHGRLLVAVSEGLRGPDGELLVQSPKIRDELVALDLKPVLDWLLASEEVVGAAGGAKKDAFGHVQLSGSGLMGDFVAAVVKTALYRRTGKALRVRADTLGYAQRSFADVQSAPDAAEAELVGRAAVQLAMAGDIDGSVLLKRAAREPGYNIITERTDLANVAGKVRDFPEAFIAPAGNDVTEAYVEYARPLVGPLPARAGL
jgi:6-phosphofructokinase 1